MFIAVSVVLRPSQSPSTGNDCVNGGGICSVRKEARSNTRLCAKFAKRVFTRL